MRSTMRRRILLAVRQGRIDDGKAPQGYSARGESQEEGGPAETTHGSRLLTRDMLLDDRHELVHVKLDVNRPRHLRKRLCGRKKGQTSKRTSDTAHPGNQSV